MAHDVFISYSHTDKPTADAACATLESRGIRCWIAPRDVLPGDEYASALVNAIHASRMLVLVFSSGANQSPQVLREVERAVSKGLPILPLRIEDVAPSAAMEYYISSRHWLDALTTPLEQHLVQLADTVTLLLARAPGGSAPVAPVQAVRPVPPPVIETTEAPPKAPPPQAPPSPPPAIEQPRPRPAPVPTDPNRAQRRRILLAAVVIIAVLGIVRGWEHAVAQIFGWTNTQMQALSGLRLLVLAVVFVAGGLRLRHFPPGKLATLAGLLYGGGLMLTGLTGAIPFSTAFLYLLTSACIAAAGAGLGYIVAVTTLLKWYPDRRGTVAGIATAAFGIGGFGVRTLLSLFGVRSLVIAGIVCLIVVTLAARVLQNPAIGYVPSGWTPSPLQERNRGGAMHTLREALRARQWFALWALLFLNTIAGVVAVVTVPARNFPPGALTPVFVLSSAAGSLVWAWISDRHGARRVLLLLVAAQALLLLGVLASYRTAEVFTMAVMFCNGGVFGLMPALAADYFGVEDVGAVYGTMLSGWCLGLLLARIPLSLLYNTTGGPAIVVATGMLLATVIAFRLGSPRPIGPSDAA